MMETSSNVPETRHADSKVNVVAVTEAWSAQRVLRDHLLQLYLHDFSEHAALGSSWGEVDDEGRFTYAPTLDSYWQEPGRVPLLIRADGRVAGFALLNQ